MSAEADLSLAVVRRGYDRAQVDDVLRALSARLEAAVEARATAEEEAHTLTRRLEAGRAETQEARATVAELRGELERVTTQVGELSVVPTTVDGMSQRLQMMVRIAQDEVNDMRSRATTGATQILTLAQAEADELRERSQAERARFEEERRSAEESLHAQLAESRERLEQLRNDSDGQRARLDAELAELRAAAERELAAELEERRRSVFEELAAREQHGQQEAGRLLDVATQEARTRVAEAAAEAQRVRAEAQSSVGDAQRSLEELRDLQHQVAEQLTSVRALLDWTLPQLNSGAARQQAGQPAAPQRPVAENLFEPAAFAPAGLEPAAFAPAGFVSPDADAAGLEVGRSSPRSGGAPTDGEPQAPAAIPAARPAGAPPRPTPVARKPASPTERAGSRL